MVKPTHKHTNIHNHNHTHGSQQIFSVELLSEIYNHVYSLYYILQQFDAGVQRAIRSETTEHLFVYILIKALSRTVGYSQHFLIEIQTNFLFLIKLAIRFDCLAFRCLWLFHRIHCYRAAWLKIIFIVRLQISYSPLLWCSKCMRVIDRSKVPVNFHTILLNCILWLGFILHHLRASILGSSNPWCSKNFSCYFFSNFSPLLRL